MKANNVVQFPVINPTLYSEEQLVAASAAETKELLDNVNDMIINSSLDVSLEVFNKIEDMLPVHDMDNPLFQKDSVFIHEAIKSAMARRFGIRHEIQALSEKTVDISKSDIQWID